MKKKSLSLLLIVTLILTFSLSLLAGCSAQSKGPEGKTFTDTLGREIKFDAYPQKIVSVAPAITEILFAIGLDSQIVGVSDYCDYPEQAQTKEKMGGFSTPNVEKIASLEPNMVFISAGVQEDTIKKLEDLGITVVVLDADTVEQVMSNIDLAGELTGKQKEAAAIVKDMQTRLDKVEEAIKDQPKPTVFIEIWDDPLMSAGSTSFVNNIIEVAGGVNIAADNTERYYNFSSEKLFEADPDYYIINTHSHAPADVKKRTGYDALSAVQNDKVIAVDDNLISRAGPRVISGVEEMAKVLHPDAFSK
ncbi:cobalamin-binding protein [Dehalobacter sp. DCM]|uniref:ABC transporter substrate-binding protein n=1 Tax=Dehalobacter sp. DCM TaxID=2907827 RepID=UPI003081684B|nr:cobalamin-binding protein [Dehalobacter sp. DCM]